MANWHAVYEAVSGRLRSVGSEVGAVPADCLVLTLSARPLDTQMWDSVTRAFVARPPKVTIDRLVDIQAHPDFDNVWQSLTPAQRTRLRTAVLWLIGQARYRAQGEAKEIGGAAP